MKTWLTTWFGFGLVATGATAATPVPKDMYAVPLKTIDGDQTTLEKFKDKTLVIVNTASKCGYTKQYPGLETLYKTYKDRGVVVLGFPSNDFWGQEPGTDAEIHKTCTTKYNVTFPMFSKGPVKGPDLQPLYAYLKNHAADQSEVSWNFEKFVVAPGGKVTARFGSSTKPDDKKLISAIEAAAPPPPAQVPN